MVSAELRSIIDALSKQGKMNFLDAASEDEIDGSIAFRFEYGTVITG